jgi:hypothetical protein
MAIRLGLDAKLYVNSSEVTNCRDLTLSLEKATADVSTRGNNGWRAMVGALKDATLEFQMVWDTADANFTTIKDAFLNNTNLYVSVEDGGGAYGAGSGLQFTGMVENFSRNEPLEEALTVDVTIRPTYDPANPPEWID